MSDNNVTDNGNPKEPSGGNNREHDAERKSISLSQAILGPLDAIFKAQLHGARSFLNLLLQIGYPHEEGKANEQDGTPFMLDFYSKREDGKSYRIKVPALALVPIQPIAISNAEYQFKLSVNQIERHRQVQEDRDENHPKKNRFKRPWFLVDDPVSIRGFLAEPRGEQSQEGKAGGKEPPVSTASRAESTISVKVTVEKTPMPAGLAKLLTTITELGSAEEGSPKKP